MIKVWAEWPGMIIVHSSRAPQARAFRLLESPHRLRQSACIHHRGGQALYRSVRDSLSSGKIASAASGQHEAPSTAAAVCMD